MAAVGKALVSALDGRDKHSPPKSHPALVRRQELHRSLLEWHARRSSPWSQQGEPWAVLVSILCGRNGARDDLAETVLAQWPDPEVIDGVSEGTINGRPRNDIRTREIVRRVKDGARAVQLHGWSVGDVALATEIGAAETDWLAAVGLQERDLVPTTGALRVADRLLGSKPSTRSKSRLHLAKVVTGDVDPLKVNIALADLARAVCRPRSPNCGDCPVNASCESSETAALPTQSQAAA